ncbi:MAG TPA: hypothetical protein VKT81_08650 [Bryobacteraceae bacterium]|nr:hypothetical protein [Bryobacteraceae bacterium]
MSVAQASITAAILWIALAIGLALTRAPWSAEAWTALPALNLAEHGVMATTVLESKNTWLQGIERHTYWLMPVHLLIQAAWYKILGFSLFKQRLLSVLCGAILLASWSRIVFLITGLPSAALAVWIILGFDYTFLESAANGRMDMACAALGSTGIAAWLSLRDAFPRLALFLGHALCAAAAFTHPCGALFAAALLLIGLSRVRPMDLLLIALPYLIAAGLWGLYIAQAPADFRAQFTGNISGFAGEYSPRARFNGFTPPVRAILDEVQLRYLKTFGFDELNTRAGVLKSIWLLVVTPAAFGVLLIPDLRSRPGVRVLLIATGAVFLMMALLEGMKFQHYLVYSLPFLSALTAISIGWLWLNRRKSRVALVAALLAALLPQVKAAADVIRYNPLRNELRSTADYLRATGTPQDLILSPAELGYELGFGPSLKDDVRLGYNTGLQPQFLVTSGWYRLWFEGTLKRDPALHAYIETILATNYSKVFTRGDYIVYRRDAR